MKKFAAIVMASVILSTSTGCLGEFALTRNVLEFNQNATDSKFINNLLFYAMVIVPVYGVSAMIDVVVLNLIEFWTGDNPLAMEEGDFQRQVIPFKGEEYIVEATKNQFKIYQEGEEPTYLRFSEVDNSWTAVKGEESQKLISLHETEDGAYYHIYQNDEVVSLKAGHDYSQEMLKTLFTNKELMAMK